MEIQPGYMNWTTEDQQSLRRSVRLFWLTYWTFLAGTIIVMIWDGLYHLTVVFDTPFSPPHVLGYIVTIETALLLLYITCTPRTCRWFGETIRPFVLPFKVPASLFILGAGMLLLACTAILDIFWHGRFGLDETNWSTPHSMIAWALCLIALGFLSARMALGRWQPIRKWSIFWLCFVFLLTAASPLLGPLIKNASLEEVRLLAQTPILLQQPPAQHTFRIYQQWNLTHTNPLFVPLMAFWSGLVFTLIHHVASKRWLAFLILACWSLLLHHPLAFWVALLLYFPLTATRFSPKWILLLSGCAFGLVGAYTWDNPKLVIVLALCSAPLMLAGGWLGIRCSVLVSKPDRRHCQRLALIALFFPFLTGLLDLYLRLNTP